MKILDEVSVVTPEMWEYLETRTDKPTMYELNIYVTEQLEVQHKEKDYRKVMVIALNAIAQFSGTQNGQTVPDFRIEMKDSSGNYVLAAYGPNTKNINVKNGMTK